MADFMTQIVPGLLVAALFGLWTISRQLDRLIGLIDERLPEPVDPDLEDPDLED